MCSPTAFLLRAPDPWPIPSPFHASSQLLALFGLFVAHVTSSFVLVGSQLIAAESRRWVKVLAIPVFVLACAVTTLMVGSDPRLRRPHSQINPYGEEGES